MTPVWFKRINGWLAAFWTVMVPVSILLGWTSSVTYVAALSIYALITGHASTWQSARVEVRQEVEADCRDDRQAGRIERKIDELRRR